MKPVSQSHRKTNVLVSFVLADNEHMFPIDQAKNSSPIRFNGQILKMVLKLNSDIKRSDLNLSSSFLKGGSCEAGETLVASGIGDIYGY
jgi:hypothetical protein